MEGNELYRHVFIDLIDIDFFLHISQPAEIFGQCQVIIYVDPSLVFQQIEYDDHLGILLILARKIEGFLPSLRPLDVGLDLVGLFFQEVGTVVGSGYYV